MMKPSEFQTTIENQFDYICKVAMEDERKDYLKALSRQCKLENLFCDMDDYTVNLFSSEDTYPSHFHTFEMDGFTVHVENSLLAEALENLDGKKRDVILRYYFLGFDDTEISKILEVNRSTIQRRRHAGLEFIKKFMEEEA
ncbi:RNA polymerase sigma factor [Faecalibacillus intestinalis]